MKFVQFRARQDKHPTTDGTRSSSSLISFDFGFASSTTDSPNKISFLACHDRDTGLVAALPAPGKGGKFFQYFVTELTRFVVSTGYREVRIQNQPHLPSWKPPSRLVEFLAFR